MAGKSNPHDVKLNEIVVQDVKGKSIVYDREMMDVLKATVAEYATDAELLMFANVAAKYGLDPFAKEIWFIKYPGKDGAKTRIETSRDGYLNIAKRDPKFKGVQSFVVYKEDVFEVEIEGAEVKNVIHKFNGFERGEVVGAWAVAEKEGQRPVYAVVPFNEYNSGKSTWKSNPSAMIKKVAESDVLKRIGGISGLVTHEEMGAEPELKPMAEKKLEGAKCEIVDDPAGEKEEKEKDYVDAEFTKQEEIKDITPEAEYSDEELEKLSNQSGLLKVLIKTLQKENHPVTKENLILEAENDERIHPGDKKKIIEILG